MKKWKFWVACIAAIVAGGALGAFLGVSLTAWWAITLVVVALAAMITAAAVLVPKQVAGVAPAVAAGAPAPPVPQLKLRMPLVWGLCAGFAVAFATVALVMFLTDGYSDKKPSAPPALPAASAKSGESTKDTSPPVIGQKDGPPAASPRPDGNAVVWGFDREAHTRLDDVDETLITTLEAVKAQGGRINGLNRRVTDLEEGAMAPPPPPPAANSDQISEATWQAFRRRVRAGIRRFESRAVIMSGHPDAVSHNTDAAEPYRAQDAAAEAANTNAARVYVMTGMGPVYYPLTPPTQ